MKKRLFTQPRCYFCNRCMSWTDVDAGVEWVPHGSVLATEPPAPENAHRACWDKASDADKGLIRRAAWQKPNE